MKRLTVLMALAFGVNAYGIIDPGPAYKYTPCWIPPEEGTPTPRVFTKAQEQKKVELLAKFKERYPEYTLSYDALGVLKEIKAMANVALSTNPLTTGTYTIENLFTEFKDLFGIETEFLQPLGTSYKGLPILVVFGNYPNFVNTGHIPDGSYGGPLVGGYKGTWSLTVDYPYQLKSLDPTPTITGTQAYEIAKKDLSDWFNWPGSVKSGFPSKEEYITRYITALGSDWGGEYLEEWYEIEKAEYERKKQLSTEDVSEPVSTSSWFSETSQQLGIFFHNNGKPYLTWRVCLRGWEYYIDAKKGKVLYGRCTLKS